MSTTARTAYGDELRAFSDLAQSFARKELLGHTEGHEYPYARDLSGVIGKAEEAGLFGISLPADCGGVGLGAAALTGVVERISAVDAGLAGVLFTHAAALEIVAAAAETDPGGCREVYQLLSGAGGVPLAFQSFASPEEVDLPEVTGDGKPLLTGACSLLALGGTARYAVAAGARKNSSVFSYYLVDLSGPGVKVSAPLITLGLQACQAVDAVLESAPALLVGTEGEGGNCFRKMQLRMSAPAAAMSLGIMRGCLREALDYAGQRWQGGRTIAEWPVVRMKLAEIAIQIDVAASCLSGILSAQGGAQAGESQAALAAAIHITDMACAATSEGVQILGGNGYMKDYGQEKRMRDARQTKSLLGMSGVKKLNYIERIITEGTI